jgi:hypothetical protein
MSAACDRYKDKFNVEKIVAQWIRLIEETTNGLEKSNGIV